MAILKTDAASDTAEDRWPIFALKPFSERQKCEIAPQEIIAQLRKSSEEHHALLRPLIPAGGNFDQRILQVRR